MSRHRRFGLIPVAAVLSGLIPLLGATEPLTAIGAPAAAAPAAAQAAAQMDPAAAPKRYVYLTFDDGPQPHYTAQVLDILRRYGVRATFFEVGRNVARYPALTRLVHQRGNSVQNHTWSHADLRHVSWAGFKYQVITTDRYVRAQTGSTPRCLRPPYGAVNKLLSTRAKALGKRVRLWTVDPRDWSRPGTSTIVHRVLDKAHSGSVILMHDGGGNRSQTVAALPTILRTLKARGYAFALLSCS